MQLFQTYYKIKSHRLINPELKLFEFSIWLHALSRSIISVFIPILLLGIGYEIKEVIIFYFLFNLINVPLNFFARWLTRKIGARLVVIVGSFFLVAYFVGLFNLTSNNWPLLFLIAVFAAVYDALYWVAHIYLFMICSKNDDNISEDASSLFIIRRLAGVIAPAIGAAILIFFGSKSLILTSMLILIISFLPLFRIKNIKDKPTIKQKKIKKFFNDSNILKDYISHYLFSIHSSVENVIWPLFIYLLYTDIKIVVALPVIISISSMIFTYFIGRTVKKKRTKMIIMGSLLISCVWIMRIFIDYQLFYYVSVFLVGFFMVLISIPLDSNIFERGERRDALTASTYLNAFSMSGKVLLFAILLVLLNFFKVSFIVAAISLLVLLLINSIFITKNLKFSQKKLQKIS